MSVISETRFIAQGGCVDDSHWDSFFFTKLGMCAAVTASTMAKIRDGTAFADIPDRSEIGHLVDCLKSADIWVEFLNGGSRLPSSAEKDGERLYRLLLGEPSIFGESSQQQERRHADAARQIQSLLGDLVCAVESRDRDCAARAYQACLDLSKQTQSANSSPGCRTIHGF